ncbi:MAG: MurR/RpiR family transcriptional regulator [Alphaproteobacteria bacterium]|nr:MurR/RpiR family transcriptional regulator [Alphaproteobacteria bacterium]
MSIIEKISRSSHALTPNERLLVQTVMDSPATAALGTASDLADSVGVHEATASRLARKLGYSNYAAFRHALRDEFIATRETATRFENTIAGNSADTILGDLAQQEMQALSDLGSIINPVQIAQVADALASANRIFLYGYGNAEVLSLMLCKRFRRFGMDVHQLDGDPRSQAEKVLGMSRGDVLLTFAFRRPPRGYEALAETAQEAGAETIVISGSSGAMLSPQPDILLIAPRSGSAEAFQTLTVPMTVCNAIVIAVGHIAKEESLKKLERLGQLIERFD